MAPITELSHLLNPLATPAQLETSSSQLDGVPKDLEDSVRFETSRLIQAAGILLHLPQEIIAQAIVILQRYWCGPDGGSMLDNDSKDVAAAVLYLTAKPSGHSVYPRHLLTTLEFLSNLTSDEIASKESDGKLSAKWYLSQGDYERARDRLYAIEGQILRTLGFQTHVALPQPLCINYLQTLDVFGSPEEGSAMAKRAFEHLNSALLSPQLVYLTHQPHALAVSAIYLAAREVDVKLPGVEWWEVFDVDREELGFLVVALRSIEEFALEEKEKWGQRKLAVSVEELQKMIGLLEDRSVLAGKGQSP